MNLKLKDLAIQQPRVCTLVSAENNHSTERSIKIVIPVRANGPAQRYHSIKEYQISEGLRG